MRIAALCGSLRQGSLNRKALTLALRSLPPHCEPHVLDIRGIPLFDGDVLARGVPDAVGALTEQIRRCDGLVIATPEYNFSIPGVLKNAIDWVSRDAAQPFDGKPVAILSASPGPLGGARVQYDLRKVMLFVNAMVLAKPEVFIGAAAGKFDAAGECTDEPTRAFVGQQMRAFVEWIDGVRRMRAPG
ncbi:NAD(P)H-dependent oxidoreductase [Caenimonas sp. DR4.4]|uniref:NAD(P)H-dependent oxidoreductase n=1 Tax=Caenimonas aquaedulcis TaxID=2793270 RepID=A0A931MJ79_9BURK|nr:NAD(P)H-dependent oxidoreductase [Caenimonas aquaedulcis]